jgi:hypothetical protein
VEGTPASVTAVAPVVSSVEAKSDAPPLLSSLPPRPQPLPPASLDVEEAVAVASSSFSGTASQKRVVKPTTKSREMDVNMEGSGEELEDDDILDEKGTSKSAMKSERAASLQEQVAVMEAVAKNNFFAAPYGQAFNWEKMCVDFLKKGGLDWSIQRIRRLVKKLLAEYEVFISNPEQPTGNKPEWISLCEESLRKISAASTVKLEKKVRTQSYNCCIIVNIVKTGEEGEEKSEKRENQN